MGQKFQKIRAKTLTEAYRKMRDHYGRDALVINSQTITEGGFLGLFGQRGVEITVSVPTPEVGAPRRQPSPLERRYTEHAPPESPPEAARLRHYEELVRDAQRRMNGEEEDAQKRPGAGKETAAKEVKIHPETRVPVAQANEGLLRRRPAAGDSGDFSRSRYSEARERLTRGNGEGGFQRENAQARSSVAQGAQVRSPVVPFPKQAEERAPSTQVLQREMQEIRDMLQVLYAENPGTGLPTEFAHHYRHLVNRGVSRKVAAQLMGAVFRNADLDVLRTACIFEERLKLEIRRRVPVSGGIAAEAGACRVVTLCGPTGVGKTTNLAKLVAQFAVRARARVATVTADTYRIAAPEQFRVYANIVGVPLKVVNNAEEMKGALEAFREYDLVFIDTAGSSQFNLEQIHELKEMLIAAQPYETILALSANTQLADLRTVVSNFKCLEPTSLLFTKVDETRQYGTLLSILAEAALPLAYISDGQNVPDDIRVANSATVANLLMEGREQRG